MKTFSLVVLALALFAAMAGCSSLERSTMSPVDRVLTGFVTNPAAGELPPDTEVTIWIIDYGRGEMRGETIGEQIIQNPGRFPVPIRIEYRAEDVVFTGRVNVEVRVSVNGRLRYATSTGHPITLNNVNDSHMVPVDAVGRR